MTAPAAAPPVTWITLPKPTFDLVGLILSSLTLTGILAAAALALGLGLGLLLIRRNRGRASWGEEHSLHLRA